MWRNRADQEEDGRLLSQINHLMASGCQDLYYKREWEEVRKQNKNTISLTSISWNDQPQGGNVHYFFLGAIHSRTGSGVQCP